MSVSAAELRRTMSMPKSELRDWTATWLKTGPTEEAVRNFVERSGDQLTVLGTIVDEPGGEAYLELSRAVKSADFADQFAVRASLGIRSAESGTNDRKRGNQPRISRIWWEVSAKVGNGNRGAADRADFGSKAGNGDFCRDLGDPGALLVTNSDFWRETARTERG